MKGKIIVFDGMDGCGKHTQSQALYEVLKRKNEKVKIFSFPNYDSDSSYFIKKLLNREFIDIDNQYLSSLFYSIDRYITYKKEIENYYNQGYIIILDRFFSSNVLYQTQNMSNSDKLEYIKFIKYIEVNCLKLPTPDVTILLISDPEVSNLLLNKRYNNDDTKRDIYENMKVQKEILNTIKLLKDELPNNLDLNIFGRIEFLYIHNKENMIYSIDEMSSKIISLIY